MVMDASFKPAQSDQSQPPSDGHFINITGQTLTKIATAALRAPQSVETGSLATFDGGCFSHGSRTSPISSTPDGRTGRARRMRLRWAAGEGMARAACDQWGSTRRIEYCYCDGANLLAGVDQASVRGNEVSW